MLQTNSLGDFCRIPGNQWPWETKGSNFSGCASRTSSLCAQSRGAAGWAGCQGGTEGLVPPPRGTRGLSRFPALALPALDCRCCCLITASSPASQGSLAGWHHPTLRVHLPPLVFPMLFPSSSSSFSKKFLFVCCSGPRLPMLWSEGWCLILLRARDKS